MTAGGKARDKPREAHARKRRTCAGGKNTGKIVLVIRETFVTTPGGRTRVLEAGAGWPVVLLHAFPLSADMWRPQLERVADGWRLVAPDLRGLGEGAAAPAGTTSIDDLAAGVEAVLDALRIETAAIGGLSMGGYVTFALFRRSPARFNAVVLADTKASADTPEGREGRQKMLDLVRREGPAAVANQMIPKLLGETSRRDRPQLEEPVRQMIEANHSEGIAGAIEAMLNRPDSTPLLARMSCPVLIIVGSEDTLTPPVESEAMQQRMERSRLVVLPAAGHLSNLETPDAFSQALADFLASNL
ncbi:alpha/beta fold hydrolase [soil metagenome]